MLTVTQLEDRSTPAPLVLPVFGVVEHANIRSWDVIGYSVYDDGTGGPTHIVSTPNHLIVNGVKYDTDQFGGDDWVLRLGPGTDGYHLAGDWQKRLVN